MHVLVAAVLLSSVSFWGSDALSATVQEITEWQENAPPMIYIYLDQDSLETLSEEREKALAAGFIGSSNKIKVPAFIRTGSADYSATVRLKGDKLDHVQTDKWSLRVNLEGDDRLLGMRTFSLQHPMTRGWLHEAIWHELLRKEGVIALRTDFVGVYINGRYNGIYFLEEHFDDELLEYNGRKPGPILKFNEEQLWSNRLEGARWKQSRQEYKESKIDAFNMKHIKESEELEEQYEHAKRVLEQVRKNQNVHFFNLKQYAKFFAVSDVLGATHSRFWHNLRFYYNQDSKRIEPVAFDGTKKGPNRTIKIATEDYDDPFVELFAQNPKFYNMYIRELIRVTSADYLDSRLAELDADIQKWVWLIQTEYPQFRFDKEKYATNSKLVRRYARWHIRTNSV